MTINKQELLEALEKVKPGLANKEIIEQSTSFAFMGDRVVTYNDEISISHPVKDLDVVGAVKSQALYQFLSKVKKDEISVSWEDNQVKISAGKAKAGLALEGNVTLPIEEIGKIGNWKDLPEGVDEALSSSFSTCSRDMSRPILTCVHIRKEGIIEASDGFRITRVTTGKKLPIKPILIPATSIKELVKYPITKLAQGEGWVHFKTDDNTIFSCRVFEDRYPDIDPIIDFKGKKLELPKAMIEVLDRANVFVDEEFETDALVSIVVDEGVMNISAKSGSGWFEESMRVKYKGDKIAFKGHPRYLTEIISKISLCEIGSNRIKFEGSNWVHVIALTS